MDGHARPMTKSMRIMFHSIPKMTALIAIAGLFALLITGQVHAGKDCGGLNQKSCWHVDPKKWCHGNLKYKPTGVPGQGRCVKRESKPAKQCGGLNQKSCWHADPTKWCKGNLQYKPTGVPGQGRCVKREPKPAKQCGGLNQKSCWHANPAKWCEGDLQYKPTGIPGQGSCVVRQKRNCGNVNQQSCWHINPAKWCSGNLKYKPTGVPGQGTCIVRVTNDDLKEVASTVVNRISALGENNPLSNLRRCLKQPQRMADLERALKRKSANGVNAALAACNAAPDDLADFGADVLGAFNSASAAAAPSTRHRGAAGAHSATRNAGSSDGKSWHLSIAAIGSGVAYVGVEGAIGYRVQLRRNPEGRFYVAGGLSVGVGLAGGGDIAVGLSYENMPTNHWARDPGKSVGYSGKFVYGGGVSIDFPMDTIKPSGFTLSGGVGAGAEAGVITGSVDQYLYNF